MKIKLNISCERIVVLLLGLMSVYIYVSELSEFLPLNFIKFILYPIIYFIGIVGYFKCIRVKQSNLIIVITIYVFLILMFLIYPNTFDYFILKNMEVPIIFSDMFYIVFISIPVICLLRCSRDAAKLINDFNSVGTLILFLFILTFIIKVLIFHRTIDYMNISYGALPWIFFSIKSKRKYVFVLRAISILLVIVLGCRGALLTTVLLYFFYFICEKFTIERMLKILMIAAISVIFIINLNSIVRVSYDGLKNLGFKSRTLELYLNISVENGLTHYSDRENLQIPLIKKINAFGYGLYGDRLLTINNVYAHNLFLELIVDFGYIIGVIISLYIIILLIKAFIKLFKINDDNQRLLLCVSLAFISCKYMVSSSYLHSPEFWFYIMIIFYSATNKEIKKKLI